MHDTVLILDFGSQYTQLIARTVRSLNVYCEIVPYSITAHLIEEKKPRAIILSGSPASSYKINAPMPDKIIWSLNIPILGICYGMQVIATRFGGEICPAKKKEYGRAELIIDVQDELFAKLEHIQSVWMSHGDEIKKLPFDFVNLAHTTNANYAAIKHNELDIYALQFHPEVVHTDKGSQIIANFLFKVASIIPDWTTSSFIDESIEKLRVQIGNNQVILGLSGGVDSSVVATLLHKAIGPQLIPIFVDTGLLRKQESMKVKELFSQVDGFSFEIIEASDYFLTRLKGVFDPEQKRKIIGKAFIDIFEEEAKKHHNAKFLAQGTLYPDIIESVSFKGPSVTIKSHHNVGGLPEKMNLELIEPLRELFKDEVRLVGKSLGLPDELLYRHPFPGPGLAVRIISDVTRNKVVLLQEIDSIFIQELEDWDLYNSTWQAFAVLLPIQSVGVMGDERTYENVCALRAVNSNDGMTADWTEFPYAFLKKVSNRIINEVSGVNRVVYDISSKPPATIEWE